MVKLWSRAAGRQGLPPPAPEPGSTIPRDLPAGRPASEVLRPQPAVRHDTRAGHRFVPRRTATVLTIAGGKRVDARIINMSAFAVAIEADLPKAGFDTVTMVGTRPVLRGRKIALGAVFIFATPLDPAACGPDIVI